MKRYVSFALVAFLVCALLVAMAVPAFAAEEPASGSVELNEALVGIKSMIKTIWNKTVTIVSNSETWTNIITALAAVLLVIFVPILIGLLVIGYALVYSMTLVITLIMSLASGLLGAL